MGEDDAPLALARVDEEGKLQRLQGLARGEHAVDDEAGERADERAGVVGGKAVVGEDGRDRGIERRIGEAPGDPVAEPPVVAVAPHVGVGGKGRIGARIPAVDVDVGEIEHRPGIDGRCRVGAGDVVGVRGIEGLVERLQVAALHDVVARAPRIVGQERLGALRIDEDVGLVGALVDGGAAELGEPEGLRLRHPGRGRAGLDAGGAIEMLAQPPVADVLEAEHPGLAGAVGDGRARLRVAIGGAGVVPVVALAGEDVAAQIGEVVGRGHAGLAVERGLSRRASRRAASRRRCRRRRC